MSLSGTKITTNVAIKQMIFTTDRSIGDQLLESILEYPEDWDVGNDLEKPSTHKHKNGVEIWAYIDPNDTKIWAPAEAKGVVIFTNEEKQRLFKVIEARRTELRETRFRKSTKLVIDKMNYVEPPPSPIVTWATKNDGPNDLPGASLVGKIFFTIVTTMIVVVLWNLACNYIF